MILVYFYSFSFFKIDHCFFILVCTAFVRFGFASFFMQIRVVDSFFGFVEVRFVTVFQENLSGTEYLGRPDN